MTNDTILLVDDDKKIRTLLRNVLEDEGFNVLEASTADESYTSLANNDIDLITLDIHLGVDSGLDIARELRTHSQVPIVMVTGKDDVIDRVVGLELGADDYITKPFHVREVVARIRSVLRRAGNRNGSKSEAADLALNKGNSGSLQFEFDGLKATPDRLELVDRNGAECVLTSGDFRLLTVFLEHAKRVLSRDQLMDLTGGQNWSPLDRTVDNQIARLRKKIERNPSEPKLIKTVRGIGYQFACAVQVIQPSDSEAKSV